MTELILSDITRMAGGYCVIGLEKKGEQFRSIRPLPPAGNAWPPSFAFHRGDYLQFSLSSAPLIKPHVEDRRSAAAPSQTGKVAEEELLQCLRGAEVAEKFDQLFGCPLRPGRTGASVSAPKCFRSICGAEVQKIRLKWEADQLRAHLALRAGEVLPDLPVVDRSWHRFAESLLETIQGANRVYRVNRYLSTRMQEVAGTFVRLGLTRPHPPRWGRCQVMVDTLFPIPRKSWLEEFRSHQD